MRIDHLDAVELGGSCESVVVGHETVEVIAQFQGGGQVEGVRTSQQIGLE
jgi:hypothetical protein